MSESSKGDIPEGIWRMRCENCRGTTQDGFDKMLTSPEPYAFILEGFWFAKFEEAHFMCRNSQNILYYDWLWTEKAGNPLIPMHCKKSVEKMHSIYLDFIYWTVHQRKSVSQFQLKY